MITQFATWEPWRMYDERSLARYVTADAAQFIGRLPIAPLRSAATPESRQEFIRAIFEELCSQAIPYDLEPFKYDSDATQTIRAPDELLQGRGAGTCIDLVTLFCGVCLSYRLLPAVVVLDGTDEGHAIAAVCLTDDIEDLDLDGRSDGGAAFDGGGLLRDAKLLLNLVNRGSYLAIDCTYMTGEAGDFTVATDEGARYLREAAGEDPEHPLRFALDVAYVQMGPPHYGSLEMPAITPGKVLGDYLNAVMKRASALPDAFSGGGSRTLLDIYGRQSLEIVQTTDADDETDNAADDAESRIPSSSRVRASASGGRAPSPGSVPALQATSAVQSADDLVENASGGHLIIEGAPGSGKTTLLNHLAVEAAKAWLDRAPVSSLPIRLRAVTYRKYLDEPGQPGESLLTAIQKDMFTHSLPDLRAEMFARGPEPRVPKWLVLIDGLDEIPTASERKDVLNAISMLEPSSPLRFVVTTRPLPRSTRRAAPRIPVYRLHPFDGHQVRDFAFAWFPYHQAKAFLRMVDDARLQELSLNPLLLTLLASVYEATPESREARFSMSRVSLYDEFVRFLLKEGEELDGQAEEAVDRYRQRWRRRYDEDGGRAAVQIFANRRRLLEQLAILSVAHPDEDLTDAAVKFASEWKLTSGISEDEWLAREIGAILRSTGLLVSRAVGDVFLHPSFAEYLAGKRLADTFDPDTPYARALISLRQEPRWREILVFALAFWGKDVTSLLEYLMSLEERSATVGTAYDAEQSIDAMVFSALAMGDRAQVSEEFERRIARAQMAAIDNWPQNSDVVLGLNAIWNKVSGKVLGLARNPIASDATKVALLPLLMRHGHSTIARKTAEALIKRSPLPSVRLIAAKCLAELEQGDTAVRAIKTLLRHPADLDVMDAIDAATLLNRLGHPTESLDVMRTMKNELSNAGGIIEVARWIGEFGDTEEGKQTIEDAATDDPDYAIMAAQALAQIGYKKEGAEALEQAAKSYSGYMRFEAASALWELGYSGEAKQILLSAMRDPVDRPGAAETLAALGYASEAATRLMASLDAPEDPSKEMLERFASLGYEEYDLQTPVDPITASNAFALARIGYVSEARSAIKKLLENRSLIWGEVSELARWLARLGDVEEAADAMRSLLGDESIPLHRRMITTGDLADAGFAEEAFEALKRMTKQMTKDLDSEEGMHLNESARKLGHTGDQALSDLIGAVLDPLASPASVFPRMERATYHARYLQVLNSALSTLVSEEAHIGSELEMMAWYEHQYCPIELLRKAWGPPVQSQADGKV